MSAYLCHVGTLRFYSEWQNAMEGTKVLHNTSGQQGPWGVPSPNSCPQQVQPWGQARAQGFIPWGLEILQGGRQHHLTAPWPCSLVVFVGKNFFLKPSLKLFWFGQRFSLSHPGTAVKSPCPFLCSTSVCTGMQLGALKPSLLPLNQPWPHSLSL